MSPRGGWTGTCAPGPGTSWLAAGALAGDGQPRPAGPQRDLPAGGAARPGVRGGAVPAPVPPLAADARRPGHQGAKDYHWAMIEIAPDGAPEGHDDGHAVLLLRKHRYTGTVSDYLCWTPSPVPLARLINLVAYPCKFQSTLLGGSSNELQLPYKWSVPDRKARLIRCVRPLAPVRSRRSLTCWATVERLSDSRWAISALDRPSAISGRMASCRGVRAANAPARLEAGCWGDVTSATGSSSRSGPRGCRPRWSLVLPAVPLINRITRCPRMVPSGEVCTVGGWRGRHGTGIMITWSA
jgi:hypothetical protein